MGKKTNKRPRKDEEKDQEGEGAFFESTESIAAFIATQDLGAGFSINPDSLTFSSNEGTKSKKNKKALSEELNKIKKRKVLAKRSQNADDDDLDEEDEEDLVRLEDAEEEREDDEDAAELAAYMEMMKEKGLAPPEDDDDDEDAKPQKQFKVDVNGLKRRLEEIRLPSNLPWIETMVITSDDPTIPRQEGGFGNPIVHDDLKRELAFLNQALKAAELGRSKVLAAGVPFSRPDDNFAEMIKTDEHMAKVRQTLLDEQAKIKNAENLRKMREAKKFGKRVQVEKQLERTLTKKAEIEKVTLARKKRKSGGGVGDDDDFGIEVDEQKEAKKQPLRTAGQKKTDLAQRSKKRQSKDERYGQGGKKRGMKRNTAESTDDFTFSTKKFKEDAKRTTKGAKGGRPGKVKRQVMRGKKKSS
ncbi:eukaryotic rRNA processing protein EBP2-domain-containing protein [Cladochytrium replicatum]|nr:eukaryotic rRNA processing protein EBP2-domain-containing protein [Cladochytrium replicatum]